jgi:predicted O-methyltransferase YrrM
MDTEEFFRAISPLVQDDRQNSSPRVQILRRMRTLLREDPCPDVAGMASLKKLKLLNLAAGCLPENGKECYLEVGSFQGKSLVAALAGNSHVRAVACDNFTLFDDPNSPKNFDILKQNLASYRLSERVQFFDCDFRELLTSWNVRQLPRVGVYFYDGAHDEESQFLGVRMAEDLLADNAVVIVDDWRHAKDSESYAEAGTKRAISDSPNEWSIRHVLPARYNGDLEQWWNGVGVLRFKRVQPMPDQMM